jgi:hypothetical protein
MPNSYSIGGGTLMQTRPGSGTPPPQQQTPPTNPLYVRPGESILDYETRLGQAHSGTGTGFGAPAPISPATVAASTASPAAGASAPGSSTNTSSNPDLDSLAVSLGYKSYADAVSSLTAPSADTTDFYNNAYKAAGLDTLSNSITSKQNDLNTATGNINDNPWLDEADRVGRTRNLTTLAEGDIKNLVSEYNTKLGTVHDLVTQHSSDLNATAASNKAKLAFLEDQAKALADQQATNAKAANTPPATIKGANGATFAWDATTGTFKQILPGKATPNTDTDPNSVVPKFNKSLADRATLDKAGTREQFIRQLQLLYPTIDPDDIAKKVYETYPDGYDSKKSSSSSSSGQRSA